MAFTILVVTAEDGIRHLLFAVLEEVGFVVRTAESTAAAQTIVNAHQIDLIVTDVRTSIFEREDYFRPQPGKGRAIPFVVMTTANGPQVAKIVGAAGYLEKPFTVFQARESIVEALHISSTDVSRLAQAESEQALRVFVYTGQQFLAAMIERTLDHGVFVTKAGRELIEAATIVRDWRPHIVIVDLDSGGEQFLDQLGSDWANGALPLPLPMVAVTRNRDLQAILGAFERGVDDVLSIPMSPEELLARVFAITRRTYGQTFPVRSVLVQGTLELDIANNRVSVSSADVPLSGIERSLLYLLAANSGELVTIKEILAAVWGKDYLADDHLVERTVEGLHTKLQQVESESRFITTFPGVGCRFVPLFERGLALS